MTSQFVIPVKAGIQISMLLPGTGRATAARSAVVEGGRRRRGFHTPSVSPAGCHLAVQGRIA